MYHLAEVRWQQSQHDAAVRLMEHSLEIMEAQVGCGCIWFFNPVLAVELTGGM